MTVTILENHTITVQQQPQPSSKVDNTTSTPLSTTDTQIKSTTTINNTLPEITNITSSTIVRPQLSRTPTSELPKSVIVHDEIRNEDHTKYLLEPLHPYLLLGTDDVIIPLNANTFTCPKCHAPHAVHYVHEDLKKGYSKDLYICLVNGLSGCGWEDTKVPVEEDIHNRIKASIGFNPLILN
ncbi:981_t:CDS:2 [Ambispora gerdemannii]|uniref:981_t:CDS:1 n=1 Tax=Ambispora gerdemannii TaxID=144530 RepID=A0A9N9FMS6_9GLOM|nr:981_t:CDS:2 [Ambispora gerdemannii]